jgi:5-methylcytosine-specific restriction enzyme A
MIGYFKDLIQKKLEWGQRRNPKWSKESKEWMGDKPCAVCGGIKNRNVHHMVPFHIDPSREMDSTNWIVLCDADKNGMNCHLSMGHLGNYKSYNSNVVFDAQYWNARIKNRP